MQKSKHRDTESTEKHRGKPEGVVSTVRYADLVRYGQKPDEFHERAHVTRLSSAPARFARNRTPRHTASNRP